MMEKVVRFIEEYRMIVEGDKVIAGISGGADSVCLFFILLKLREALGTELVAVHVNHGIRGEAAKADEEFVVRLCGQHDVKCMIYHEDVELIAKMRKQSVEEAGRMVRREAFEKALLQEEGTRIAMAHHQNDNAETLLMNLARGTSLKGLGGILPVNGRVIRPLLCVSRKEIEDYVAGLGCGYCQDETNDRDEYTRNRIRHLVIPVLEEQVNSQAVRHMNEAMEQLRLVQEYMELQMGEAGSRCLREPPGGIQLLKTEFEAQPHVLQRMLVRQCIANAAGAERDISKVHVEAVLGLLEKQCGRSRSLPGGIRAVRNYEGVLLERMGKADGGIPGKLLKIPGTTIIPELNLTICSRILEKPKDFSVNQIPRKTYTKWFDYDIIKGSLIVRTRQGGDSIAIDRTGKRQKLKSYFINEKIQADKRGDIPLIADQNQVLWIVGYRRGSSCLVTDETTRILEIKVTEEKGDARDD